MRSRDGCVYLITGKHSFILRMKTDPTPTKTDSIFMDQLETLIRLRSRLGIHFKILFKHLNSINGCECCESRLRVTICDNVELSDW